MNLHDFFRAPPAARPNAFARYSDLALVAGLVAIVAMMILPLPGWTMDVLVAVNIAIGLVLLLMGIYITSPLEFSVFPSVLLMTTLFRLALSIAATRMILIEGHAGHIIDTFGKVVAGGNLVVGLVVFLIITIVQFIVIAKGAERVSEVAARFSLDAMPGKQLSIDSDLRAGLIDKDEARRRRRTVEQESKLHGSLDGAMKFVKGDAIAGIVIIAINLLGGLAIGVMQLGMDVGAAIEKYSILTIGDGMVAQIPALLGAMAAGLIVTRGSDEPGEHLGDAVRRQFLARPRVLVVAGGLCLLMAMVPGFPKLVFVALALAAIATGALLTPSVRERLRHARPSWLRRVAGRIEPPEPVVATAVPATRPSVPLLLAVPATLLSADDAPAFRAAMEEVLERFQLDLGLALPRIHFHGTTDAPGRWELLAYEVPLASGEVAGGVASIAGDVRVAIGRQASLFVGLQDTMNLLNRAANEIPDVVKEVLRVLPLQRVTDVLRRLVGEGVSIRNLRDVLEALADAGQRDKDAGVLTDVARRALSRQITHRVAPDGRLRAVLLTPQLEEIVRKATKVGNGTVSLALDHQSARRIVAAIAASVAAHRPAAVLAQHDVRWVVRKLIETDCFDVPVLAYQELVPTIELDVLDRLEAPGPTLAQAA